VQSVTGIRRVFDVGLGIGRVREQRLLRSLGADLERETQLRRALAEVVRAQDAEARRVAELLHDDAVQALTALSLRLELTAMQREDETLAALARDAASITAAIRRLLVDLHPAVLESRGLGAAIESVADGLRTTDLDVAVARFEHRLPPELEQLEEDALRCAVDDDGVGTRTEDVAHALGRGSLGIHLVRERIELAGGRLSVGPNDFGGTCFAFDLPIPDHASVAIRPAQEVHA
jgi:signal transduction histidine kinase